MVVIKNQIIVLKITIVDSYIQHHDKEGPYAIMRESMIQSDDTTGLTQLLQGLEYDLIT